MMSGVQRIQKHGLTVNSIIDIGASDGSWSKGVMKYFPAASYLAIEPLQERQAALQRLRQKAVNFDFELCVAGETDVDSITLNVTDDLDGSTVEGDGGVSRQVPGKSIDTLVLQKKLRGPFLLKFDTHGFEVPILKGAANTLADTNVVIMEVYNFQLTDRSLRFHEMCIYMEDLGFRCYDLVEPMLRAHDLAFWQMDLFFCRKDSNIFSHAQYK
jgi:FkbM family methyltransferase